MQTMGWNMEPLVWWWRMWSGVIDPERQNELQEARALADEEEQRATTLEVALADVERERDALRTRLDAATRSLEDGNSELQRMHDHVAVVEGEAAELRARVDELADAQADADRLRQELDALRSREQQQAAQPESAAQPEPVDAPVDPAPATEEVEDAGDAEPATEPDLSAAAGVLGRAVKLDDLTVVEGVGPKIAELLTNAGITTWAALASAEPERLRGVLDDAGPRYHVHDPSSWPTQADALASGQWERFAELRSQVRTRR